MRRDSDCLGWPRSAILLAVVACIIGITVITATIVLAVNLRARAITERLDTLSSDTLMLSAHADAALQSIESVQNGILNALVDSGITTAEQYQMAMASFATHTRLTDRSSALPYVDAVTIIDRNGKLLAFSRGWPTPDVNVSDRDYFKALSQSRAPDQYISEPVRNRGSGSWNVYIARRVSAPDGAFLGLVLGAIDLSYFQRFFAEAAPGDDAVTSMIRADGMRLVRQPPSNGQIGLTQSTESTTRRILRSGAIMGVGRNIGALDGQDRLVAVHKLVHYPVFISLSRTVDATLRPWRKARNYLAAFAILFDAGLAAIVVLGMRHLRASERLTRVQAALAVSEENQRHERKLADYYERFNTAVNTMSQGLCMFNMDNTLIAYNPKCEEIFGLRAQSLAFGMSLGALMRAGIRSGTLSIDDIRQVNRDIAATSTYPHRASVIWDVANGLALSVDFGRTADTGWLITFTDITERRRTEAQITHMARHDALTGLANRVLLRERLVQAVGLADRGIQQAILCLDLDHFKDVNDRLGHPAGDAVLQGVTTRLLRCVRETDTVARLGGDEFAIILSSLKQPRDADTLADRIIAEIGLPFDIDGQSVIIGASIGIALAPDDSLDPDILLKNADLALYRAKADGGGCRRYFELQMDILLHARHTLELELRSALINHEFELHYQPLVATATSRVCAFEALLRWRRPDGVSMGPAEFIPMAEETGLIIPLSEWILHTACMAAASWGDEVAVAVNISSVHFKSHGLVEMVRQALQTSGLAPHRLEIEITETILLNDTDDTLATLNELRTLGVLISMDDFGTGYSSLNYLLRFPFDKVKIDRSFTSGLGDGGNCDAIVEAVTAMCHNLHIKTTAEGVETQEQATFLTQRHCTSMQGYLFSRAVPGSEVGALLASFETAGDIPIDA
jgi:diguanylate cyclase (GGDEF)-like protein